MKANGAPEKFFLGSKQKGLTKKYFYVFTTPVENDDIEYVRTDAFIEKAKKWFEKQNEWFDPNGNRHCDLNGFEDFRKYMEGE